MSVMNMPGFTAEDSLYKTSGHYQTVRHGINLPAQTIGTIHLAATKEEIVGHEVIPIEGGYGRRTHGLHPRGADMGARHPRRSGVVAVVAVVAEPVRDRN